MRCSFRFRQRSSGRRCGTPPGSCGCLPGLQQDADDAAGQFAGRLKVRIGGHTITYRGTLTVTEQDGAFSLVGEGTEARGSGSARVTLTIRPTEAPEQGGTLLALRGETDAKGRLRPSCRPTRRRRPDAGCWTGSPHG